MAANTEYTKIKESTISAFFSKLKAFFWPKADVVNINLSDVAVTGDYDDLVNKPTIPPGSVVDQTYDATSVNAQSGVAMAGALAGKQDTIDAQHKLSYTLISDTPTIPSVPTISTDISADASSDAKTASPKAVYDFVKPATDSSIPVGGMLPGVLYNLGTLTGSVTVSFAAAGDASVENEYKFTFNADSTAPTITWPNTIIGWAGNCLDNGAPLIAASKHYEVSVVNGYGLIAEF